MESNSKRRIWRLLIDKAVREKLGDERKSEENILFDFVIGNYLLLVDTFISHSLVG